MNEAHPAQRSFLKRVLINENENRLRAGWRLLGHFTLLLVLCSCMLLPFAAWMNATGATELLMLIGQFVVLLAITLSIFLARRFLDRRSFTSLGLSWSKQAAKDLLVGIAFAGLMIGAIFAIEWTAGWLEISAFAWSTSPIGEVLISVLEMLVLFILVGWQEELLNRGYWLQNLAEGTNLFWGVLISSSLFALAHLGNPNVSWNAILGLVLAGLFLAYGYLRTRQLWLSIGLHIGWNFFEGTVFGFQVSGLENLHPLVIQTVQGPDLLTGARFGPEAGLVVVPGLLLGTALIYWYTAKDRK